MQSDAATTLATLRTEVDLMERYLQLRLRLRDWHGVMDAAADIRELEAMISCLTAFSMGDTML